MACGVIDGGGMGGRNPMEHTQKQSLPSGHHVQLVLFAKRSTHLSRKVRV